MTSFDTNIIVHSANEDSPHHAAARDFLEDAATRRDIAIAEVMLVEIFLKLCNAKIFCNPMSAAEAGRYCQALRNNRNWRLVESAPVMDEVWGWTQRSNFAFRRIIDIRLGLTLRHAGVNEFATGNPKDFQGLGFRKLWNPLEGESRS
jgi:toxin-antitoxin system PIN domain toxin